MNMLTPEKILIHDIYIETGDIKAVCSTEERVTIEIWINSNLFSEKYSRKECKTLYRRSIQAVLKLIHKIAKGRKVILEFMCDEGKIIGDTLDWYYSVYPIIRESRKTEQMERVILYTGKNPEETLHPSEKKFRMERDRLVYEELLRQIDVLITQQENPYVSAENRIVCKGEI